VILTSLPLHRLVPSNQNSEITSALLQMQSLLSPLPPLSVGRPAGLLSLLQHCLPQRESESTLPSRFHPRSGDLQNLNANDLLLPRLKTCWRSSNLKFTLCEPAISNHASIPSAPKSTRPSSYVLSTGQFNNFVVTNSTTGSISDLHARICFHPQLRFLYLLSDPWYNLLHTFA